MHVLVTGGAGFIGSHISLELASQGYKVICIDDLSGGDQNFWDVITKNIDFIHMDLCDREKTDQIIDHYKPEVAFHCAATAREGASHFDPVNMVNRNIVTYANTIESCIKAKSLKKVVLFSSMAVYGNQKPPFSEDMPKKPVDIYAQCKVFMEDSIVDLSEAHDFEYTIVRPHNVYGPGQSMSDRYRNVIMLWTNALLRKEPIYIYGNGSHTRAFSYIEDSLDSYIKCGFQKGLHKEIINIGSAKEYTLNELCNIILEEFFGTKEIKELKTNLVRYLPDRFKEVDSAFCTVDKSVSLLEFKEKHTLREGIKKTIKHAKEINPRGIDWCDYKLPLRNSKCPSNWP